jgi:hypothetical protein
MLVMALALAAVVAAELGHSRAKRFMGNHQSE